MKTVYRNEVSVLFEDVMSDRNAYRTRREIAPAPRASETKLRGSFAYEYRRNDKTSI